MFVIDDLFVRDLISEIVSFQTPLK